MRTILTTVAVLCLAGVALSRTAQQYTFSFTVQVDDQAPVALKASVMPGASQTLQAAEHLRVEIEAPTSIDDTSVTVVRLIDDSSGNPVVLHTARRVGPVAMVRSFKYAVCGGAVNFQSPAKDNRLGCVKHAH